MTDISLSRSFFNTSDTRSNCWRQIHLNSPRNQDLQDAVEALLKGENPVNAYTDVIGCPIEKRIPFNELYGHAIFPALKSAN